MENPSSLTGKKKEPEANPRCRELQGNIHSLKARANRGLWALALFIAVSIAALDDFSFFPSFPAKVHALLGAAPPANLISIALIVYTFSAIILILSRMTLGKEGRAGFVHVAYLSAFYGFYHFAHALEDNFWPVFAAGVTILGLESYHVWTHFQGKAKEEQEVLDRIKKNL